MAPLRMSVGISKNTDRPMNRFENADHGNSPRLPGGSHSRQTSDDITMDHEVKDILVPCHSQRVREPVSSKS